MRASTYPLVDADVAAALVLDRTPVLPKERVAIGEAVGRVLAEDLHAASELTAFSTSAVDGFAVRAADAGETLRVLGESAAGRPFAGGIERGAAARILTRRLLPAGADTGVMVEDGRLAGAAVPRPGQYARGAKLP